MADRFDEALRRAAQDYHRPPETPREEMWTRIAARLERGRRGAPAMVGWRPWIRWTLAAAAVLALGIGIGRWTAPSRSTPRPGGAAAEPPGSGLAYRVAATQYLVRAEALLTSFRAGGSDPGDARFAGQAAELLTATRLLLDSPAGRDPQLRALLEDLELVLVQISLLDAGPGTGEELALITQGLEQRGVLARLRSAIPAGPVAGAQQGVL